MKFSVIIIFDKLIRKKDEVNIILLEKEVKKCA